MDEDRPPGSGEDRAGACHGCGWIGTVGSLRGAGPGEDGVDPTRALAPACPRCGSTVVPEPPSVGEILAARRAPGA